jgi:hypothetical protein
VRRHESDVSIQVPVKALNDEIERIRPTFLIMDTQGSEHELLRCIDLSGIRKVMVEFHSHVLGHRRVTRLRRLLRRKGYLEMAREESSILYARRDTARPSGGTGSRARLR